jgi:hypothetical protein
VSNKGRLFTWRDLIRILDALVRYQERDDPIRIAQAASVIIVELGKMLLEQWLGGLDPIIGPILQAMVRLGADVQAFISKYLVDNCFNVLLAVLNAAGYTVNKEE